MGWKVVFAPRAQARPEEIVRYIAQDDPQAAIRLGDYLVDRAESLADFPELWDTVPQAAARAPALVQTLSDLLSSA